MVNHCLSRGMQNWIPTIKGILKVNFDGTVFFSSFSVGIGVIIRDHTSIFMARWDAEVNEAMAAINFTRDIGF